MRRLKIRNKKVVFRALMPLLLCTACQLGYGLAMPNLDQPEAQITPRTKGPTLEITPRTKGSTLFQGTIIWPEGVAYPGALSFNIQSIVNDEIKSVQSAADGSFDLMLPENTLVRLEAQAMFDPELILKTVLQMPESSEVQRVEISLQSTAVVALMDYAKKMASGLQHLPMETFYSPEIMPQVLQLEQSMKPFLETNMQSSLESMPSVQDAMKKGHEELMRLYQENPEFMN